MYRRKPYKRPYAGRRAVGTRRLSTLRGRGLYVGGRGGYMSDFGNSIIGGFKRFAGSSAGKATAKIARRMGGMAARDAIGAMGGNNALSKAVGAAVGSAITGSGAYSMTTGRGKHLSSSGQTMANALLMGRGIDNIPHFTRGTDDLGSLQTTHLEYLGDVFGGQTTGAFAIQSYAINPGIEKTFRWLSQLAVNFDEYELKQLSFRYRATVSDLTGTNGQVGTVIMATNYNADEPAFVSKGQMMQYTGAVSGKCSQDVEHYVECSPGKNSGSKGKWVRTAPVMTGQDIKTYDLGTFEIAVTGIPEGFVNQPLGELWMSYTIELRKPKLFSGAGQSISTDYVVSQGAITCSGDSTEPGSVGLCDAFGLLPVKNGSGAGNITNWTAASFAPLSEQLRAQQNTIGVQIVALPNDGSAEQKATGSFGILFPAAFEGIVEISLDAQFQAAATPMNDEWSVFLGLPNLWSTYATANAADVDTSILASIPRDSYYPIIGNWRVINDMPWYDGSLMNGNQPRAETVSAGWFNGYLPLTTAPSAYLPVSYKVHIAVTQSTNGIPNIVPLTAVSNFAQGDTAILAQCFLRVVEYNTMGGHGNPPQLINAMAQALPYYEA